MAIVFIGTISFLYIEINHSWIRSNGNMLIPVLFKAVLDQAHTDDLVGNAELILFQMISGLSYFYQWSYYFLSYLELELQISHCYNDFFLLFFILYIFFLSLYVTFTATLDLCYFGHLLLISLSLSLLLCLTICNEHCRLINFQKVTFDHALHPLKLLLVLCCSKIKSCVLTLAFKT